MPDSPVMTESIVLSTLLELARELTIGQRSADDPASLHTFLHHRIFPKLEPFAIELYLLAPKGEYLVPAGESAVVCNPRVPSILPRGLVSYFSKTDAEQPVIIQEKEDPPSDIFRQTGNLTHILFSLRDRESLIGAIYLGAKKLQYFTREYLSGLATITSIIGSRLKSMDTIRQLQHSMHALESSEHIRQTLHEISEQSHNADTPDRLYQAMHKAVANLIPARNFGIVLVEKERDATLYRFPYYADLRDCHLQGQEIRINNEARQPLIGYMLENLQPLLLTPENFETPGIHNQYDTFGPRPFSLVGAPFSRPGISGAVIVKSYGNTVYTEKDMQFLSFVARHVGDALGRKKGLDELRRAKERAEQAEKNKSAFLATMSHEIRTPMNSIIGMTNLSLEMELPDEARTYLEMVRTSADRLLGLINDILDFSKIEAGKLELLNAPFQIRHVIANTVYPLEVGAAGKDLALTAHVRDEIPEYLVGDSGRLCQVITNLISNGIKFTEQGGVTLNVSKAKEQPEHEERITLLFRVSDTGRGIDPDKIHLIFQPFRQLGTAPTAEHGGTGLGLVIAADLVEKMNGRIWLESVPDEGTTFCFTAEFGLSAFAEISAEFPRLVQKKKPDLIANLTVLLAEDDYINRTLATTLLERAGWQVITAENGHQVLELLQQHPDIFDLILMDIQMPGLDGLTTSRLIRNHEETSGNHIPIIAMTAYAVKGDREKCFDAGMDGYISKPIRPGQLQTEIESILHGGRIFETLRKLRSKEKLSIRPNTSAPSGTA